MKTTDLCDPYADFQKFILPNGLTVYHSHWNCSWLRVGFVVHSGSFADAKGKEGVAHFVEHMVSDNINGASKKDAKLFFRRLGGDAMFGATGPTSTSYWFVIPAKSEILTKGLEIFGSMLLENSFERHMERERNVISCEFDDKFPLGLMYDLYEIHKRKMLYEGLGMQYYKGNLGDRETISAITKEDLLQFYAANYVPENMSVVVIGNMKSEELLRCFNGSAFSKKKSGERNLLPQKCNTSPKPKETKYTQNLSDFISNTSINIASYESFTAMPGSYNLKMLELFKGMINFILNDEIRQKFGVTYDFGASITDYVEVRELQIGGRISPVIVEQVNEIVQNGLLRIKKERELFDDLKAEKLNRYLLLDVSGHIFMKDVMDDLEICHRIVSLREEVGFIKEVRFGEICELADYIADPSNRWTLIEYPQ